MQFLKRITAEVEHCTGCNMCALACSLSQKGVFNPRYAKIRIHKELSGLVTGIEFTDQCNRELSGQCTFMDLEPNCVKYCIFKGLKLFKGRTNNE